MVLQDACQLSRQQKQTILNLRAAHMNEQDATLDGNSAALEAMACKPGSLVAHEHFHSEVVPVEPVHC